MNDQTQIPGLVAYRPPGGTVCVPPGTFSSIPTGILPRPAWPVHNIIVGMGEFGKQVLREFRQINTVYRTGFNWEKTQIICLGCIREIAEESSRTVFIEDQEGLRTILEQVRVDRSDMFRVILVADVTHKAYQKIVAELVIESYQWQTMGGKNLNWYLLLNVAPDDLITTRRQQAIFLRELDFWLQPGYHTPLPGQNREDKLINSAIVLNEVEFSPEALKQAVLSLFSLFYSQSYPDSNIIGVKLRALGTPWLTLVQYFAVKLAMDWLTGNAGIFPSYALTQDLVNNAPTMDLRAASTEDFLRWLQDTLNSREELRWATSYVAIYNKLGERPLRSLSNFFPGKSTFYQMLQASLQARATQAQAELSASTQDKILRWNVPVDQSVMQANGLFKDLFSDNLKNSIFKNINTHVQVHCELKDNNLNFVPLCVPSTVPTTFDYHQFGYPFPDKLGFFVGELVKLFADQITSHFETLPKNLPPIDTSYNQNYFDELVGIKGDSSSTKYFVFSSDREWPSTRNFCFPKTVKTEIVNLNEPQLIIGMIQDIGLSYRQFPSPNVYSSLENLHFDPHLRNAAFFESLEDSDDHAPFCRELVLTLYDRNLVVLFWKAFDRNIISWVGNTGWTFILDGIHESLGKPTDGSMGTKRKNVGSLWDAYEDFTIRIRANLQTQDSVSPFNKNAFMGTMQKIKSVVSKSPKVDDNGQWFSEEIKKLQPSEQKYMDLYRLYRICRLISIEELA